MEMKVIKLQNLSWKRGELLKNIKKAKIRKTLSKAVSGKAITETNIT